MDRDFFKPNSQLLGNSWNLLNRSQAWLLACHRPWPFPKCPPYSLSGKRRSEGIQTDSWLCGRWWSAMGFSAIGHGLSRNWCGWRACLLEFSCLLQPPQPSTFKHGTNRIQAMFPSLWVWWPESWKFNPNSNSGWLDKKPQQTSRKAPKSSRKNRVKMLALRCT